MRWTRLSVAAAVAATVAGTAGAGHAAPNAKTTSTTSTTTTSSTSSTTTTTSSVGSATPSHFAVGVMANADSKGIDGWMPRAGVPFDYAYRYIGGGLNTGGTRNWTEWATNATFPINYATDAAARGYTPVLSYYTLNAAIGPCSACNETQTDLSNLNSPTVMALFYADFAKLMQRLGTGTYDGVTGFGGKAVVHVEPDLSGHAEMAVLNPGANCYGFCTGVGNDPALLKASVASSGYADAASYPNTYRGFNETLLHLRDLYAPNVQLALHVSNWATGFDLNSATTALDATALGQQAGQFAALSGAAPIADGVSTYDMLFNDVSNKDAAYYTYVLHKPRFWDQNNVLFPNFHQWEAYVKAATTVAGKKAIVWQVPIGNQLYLAENNTPGHYQDNRVQYIFGHISELAANGIVGALFGSTLSDATTYWDQHADGVTNPAPVCNSDGWSDGRVVCTSISSPVADDDGGYLRVSVQQYYAHPYPLS